MRRIIHNTTAIAACLSLMAPHLAMAQTDAPGSEATQQPANEAAGLQAAPAEETCADGSAPPCDDAAPAEQAEQPAEAEEAPAEEPAEEPAAENAAPEEEAPSEPAAEEAEAEPEAEAEAESGLAEEPAEEAPAEEEQAAPETAEEPAGEAETVSEQAPADEASAEATEAPAEEPAASEEPARTEEATSEEQSLEEALAAEEAENNPDAPAASETEQEGTTEAAQPADEGAENAAPEQNAVETEAAKEAAEASAPAAAAALSADPVEAEVTEEEVTEENSRSSAEDFATRLTDALEEDTENAAQQQEASNDDDDDDNDLVKALLLGGAGIAVGAMLANNRQVALSSPDRVVVTRADGSQQVIKDEVALLRQPGSTVTTENFSDGSSRTIVTREDGSQVVTIRDANLRVLRRTLVGTDGTERQLIDDTTAEPVDVATLPAPAATSTTSASQMDEAALREALLSQSAADRRFTLSQIRDIAQVRSLVAPVNIDSITFDTGSAAIKADQAEQLSALGNVIRDTIAENPGEMFMIEGYTDTVGADAANLALSDRRAESVALALSEYFDVPPENMVVQGYGEEYLMVNQEGDVRENRRASVRRITELLQTASN